MSVSYSIPSDLKMKAETIAEKNGMSLTELISKAVAEYLEELEDTEAVEDALKEFEKNPKTYTMEEVRKQLGLL